MKKILKYNGIKTFRVFQKLQDQVEKYSSIFFMDLGTETKVTKAYWLKCAAQQIMLFGFNYDNNTLIISNETGKLLTKEEIKSDQLEDFYDSIKQRKRWKYKGLWEIPDCGNCKHLFKGYWEFPCCDCQQENYLFDPKNP